MILPVELFYTFSIPSHTVMPRICTVLEYPIYHIELYRILLCVWLFGTIIQLSYTLKQFKNIHTYKQYIEKYCIQKTWNTIPYYIDSNLESAIVLGIKGIIVLPDQNCNHQELEDILLHEMCHIQNKDILKKYFIQILVCVYWWFLPIYIFQKECDLIMEMNVDFKVCDKMEPSRFISYTKHILTSAKQGHTYNQVAFSIVEKNTLQYRIYYLMNGYKIKKTSDFLLCSLLFLIFLSTLIVCEPISEDAHPIYDFYSSQDQYIIHKTNNSYHLFIDGNDLGKISNIHDSSLKNIEIIEEAS